VHKFARKSGILAFLFMGVGLLSIACVGGSSGAPASSEPASHTTSRLAALLEQQGSSTSASAGHGAATATTSHGADAVTDPHAPATTSHGADAVTDPHAPATTSHGADGGLTTSPVANQGGAPHWEYTGPVGQLNWADLSKDFTACVDGSAQSPVNISDPIMVPLDNIQFHYQPSLITVVNNGHTIQANVGQGSYITVDGQQFQLLQFHYHWPSEHTVAGKQYFMEMHLVHKNDHDELAVVGVLMERGNHNTLLDPVWSAMPMTAGEEHASSHTFDFAQLLPEDPRTFRYPGSLTTPPCSEGVRWMVFADPIQVSAEQVDQFKNVIGYDSRYTQPMHGREVLLDASMD